ncbi:hypothetical protein V2J09_022617 [Rumex salicifolius]
MVRRWEPSFIPEIDSIRIVSTWIRLSNLPIILYEERVLSIIASSIGRPLRVDKNTLLATRGKFAHICIFISCGRYGHLSDRCPHVECPTPQEESRENFGNDNPAHSSPVASFLGTWMMPNTLKPNLQQQVEGQSGKSTI